MDLHLLIHHAICGGLAAAGFGVLFNADWRAFPLCGAAGGLMLLMRTIALERGWSMVGASFVAALAGGAIVQILPSTMGVSRNALHVLGCIPMIPGAFAAKAMLGLFAITAHQSAVANDILITALNNSLRVVFTLSALGTGLAIPILLTTMRREANPAHTKD
jgi:uncharacterized membrane protein YjjB (DUF3815 family)